MASVKEKNIVKNEILAICIKALEDAGYDICGKTKENMAALPILIGDEEGYATVSVSIPTGSRDGEAYDGYEEAENYKFQLEEKAKKAAAKEAEKAKKIARDEKRRASAAEKKQAHEQCRRRDLTVSLFFYDELENSGNL